MEPTGETVTISTTMLWSAVSSVGTFGATVITLLLKKKSDAKRITSGAGYDRRSFVGHDVHTVCREESRRDIYRLEAGQKELNAKVEKGFESVNAKIDERLDEGFKSITEELRALRG